MIVEMRSSGGFIWSSPKIKLNKREPWKRAWSNSGPALGHGRQLCPEQGTHRVEAGSNGTCTTPVTPGLDACPKLTRAEGSIRAGASLPGENTPTVPQSAKVEWDFYVASRRKGVSLTLRHSRGDPLPALGLIMPSQDPGESTSRWPDPWLSLHRCCSCHPMLQSL